MAALRRCFRWIAKTFPGKRVLFPRIGAGLGGGSWPQIARIIMEELAPKQGTVVLLPA
jgi:O-acetyl-ADP-ribose deacetylase (regulator of RNase III)